ncbi:hypothetical protein P7C70_g2581, partial [Phenoliferia sp. Uapishka_3]
MHRCLHSLFLGLVSLALFPPFSSGQFVGSVGPTTALSAKTTICNVLKYGGKADNSTDIAAAINSAFTNCVKKTAGSRLVIPSGNYLLATTVTLTGGTNWAFQLDGVITASFAGYTAGTLAGNMLNIVVQDVEAFQCTNMLMMKSYPNGATPGFVKDVVFRNFTGIDNTYTLYLTEYWQNSATSTDKSGVRFSNITFEDWRGSVDNGLSRGAVVLLGSAPAPAYDFNIVNFSFWTVNGKKIINKCSNTYGSGACLRNDPASREKRSYPLLDRESNEKRWVREPKLPLKHLRRATKDLIIPSNLATYTATQTITAAPSGWTSYLISAVVRLRREELFPCSHFLSFTLQPTSSKVQLPINRITSDDQQSLIRPCQRLRPLTRRSIMRFATALVVSALATLGQAKPLTEESSTAVRIDRSHALLDAGELVVHVLRTDDLLSDYTPRHERSLILERLTHVVVRVQLDAEATTLAINDEQLDIQALVAGGVEGTKEPRAQVVKASAYRVPSNTQFRPEDLEAFADVALPKGIVSVELSIEEDKTDAFSVAVPKSETDTTDGSVTMHSYNVFVKITEIEQHLLTHSTTVLVPILKVQLTYADQSGKPVSMKAYAIRPRKAHSHHGEIEQGGPRRGSHSEEHSQRPSHSGDKESPLHGRPQQLAEIDEGERLEPSHGRFHHEEMDHESQRSHRHHHEEFEEEDAPHSGHRHHRGPPSFVRWIAHVFGMAPPHHGPPPPFRHHGHDEHSHGHSHGHHEEHSHGHSEEAARDVEESGYFGGSIEEAVAVREHLESKDVVNAEAHHPRPHHRRPHFRPHHHHPRPSVFFFISHIVARLALATAAFFGFRAIRKSINARRAAKEGGVRLGDEEEKFLDEKAPAYEEPVEVLVVVEKA